MRTASAFFLFLLSLMASANVLAQAPTPSGAPLCGEVEKRTKFDAAQVTRDVAAYDSDNDQSMMEVEYRSYLLACDRSVRSKKDNTEKEKEVETILFDLVTSRDGLDCVDTPTRCAFGKRPLHVVQAFSVGRDGDLFVAFKPKVTEIVPSIGIGRSVLDATSPLSSDPVAKVPFLVSYKRDYAKKEEAGLLLGKITYGPWFWGEEERWDGNVSATLDVNTGKKREESTVAFGATSTYTRAFGGNGFSFSITPEYGTDGNGDRDVVTLRTQLAVMGEDFLGAGQWKRLGRGDYSWDPSLTFYCGEVRDDGGNTALAKIAQQGSYCRAQPGIQMRWRADRMAEYAFGMRLAYSQTYDLQDDWDRGYGELEATLGIKESPLQLILLYRKGRKAPAFEDERALIFGIGIQL